MNSHPNNAFSPRLALRFRPLLALAFLLSVLPLPAQDTNGAPPFNDALEDAVGVPLTNDVTEPDSAGQAGDQSSTNGEMQSNRNDQAGSRDGRYRRSRRQRQNSYSAPAAGTLGGNGNSATNGPASLDYAAFRVVADRNIFNPNRQSYRFGESRSRSRSVESFSLVGIMSYEKGTFAFFDGTGSEYRKALKTNDTIAGYQLTAIEPNAVKLAIQTNELVLRVGMQMRREEDGPWLKPSQPDTVSASLSAVSSSSTNSAPDAPSSGTDNEILKRLMQRREQE